MALMRGDDPPQVQPHQPVYLPEDRESILTLTIRRFKKFWKWFSCFWIFLTILWLFGHFFSDSGAEISLFSGIFYFVTRYFLILAFMFAMIWIGTYWIGD